MDPIYDQYLYKFKVYHQIRNPKEIVRNLERIQKADRDAGQDG